MLRRSTLDKFPLNYLIELIIEDLHVDFGPSTAWEHLALEGFVFTLIFYFIRRRFPSCEPFNLR